MNQPAQINVTIQSGRPDSRITISDEAQRDVERAYLSAMRQRFRVEIDRLTAGAMATVLEENGMPPDDVEALAFLMTYVYAWHWLQRNVHRDYQRKVLDAFLRGKQGFLMEMLLGSDSSQSFIHQYLSYWKRYEGEPRLQQQQILRLMQRFSVAGKDEAALVRFIDEGWRSLGLLETGYAEGYKVLAKQEKERYAGMLGDLDRERLALVDALPDETLPAQDDKFGVIPAMGCPQTCRHCMFIFRPLMKNNDDPLPLYRMLDGLSHSVLFTGGDLTRHLAHFYTAITQLRSVTTFAILLNGDFADSVDVCRQVMENMAQAVRRRPADWPRAKVMLQISFDEFHQEVVVDRQGALKERIPVTKIANIVEVAPLFRDEIQLCLLHKQIDLNFSMALFQKGVFARLASELARRGHRIQVLSTAPSSRLKRNPVAPEKPAPLIRDATFVLTEHPDVHMLLTSTTIDAYGRANMMELHEAVNERDLLEQMLSGGGTDGEYFDDDLMYWFNGWVTLFSAVHVCLGNVMEEGVQRIRQRRQKDPLTRALHDFDLRLLDYYREKSADLDEIIARSTSPHHLFHTITEEAAMRLHMTRRLLGLS